MEEERRDVIFFNFKNENLALPINQFLSIDLAKSWMTTLLGIYNLVGMRRLRMMLEQLENYG